MIKTEVQKARAACEGNSSAALLLIYIFQLDNMKGGGVVIDGRRFNYGNLAELAEATDFTPSATEKLMKFVCDRNLAERRMTMVKIGGTYTRKLCFRLTSRGTSFMKGAGPKNVGSEPEGFPVETGEFSGHDQKIFGSPLYVTLTSPETQPNLSSFAPSGDEPSPPAPAEKTEEKISNPEGQVMQPKIEKGKNSAKDLLKETYKKTFPASVRDVENHVKNQPKKTTSGLLHKPDKQSQLVIFWKDTVGAYNAAHGKGGIVTVGGKDPHRLRDLAKKVAPMDVREVIAYGVNNWLKLRQRHLADHPGDEKIATFVPSILFLWTMRDEVCNQLHSSKTAKKQEAVASSVPSTQLTAITAPAPASVAPPKKQIASPETAAAIKAKSTAALAAKKAGL